MSIECNRVRAWLKSRWQVKVPDDWLAACIEWINSENEGLPMEHSALNQMVYEQWLVCDLRELGVTCLPEDLADQPKVVLKGKYCLQLNSVVDASTPYYGQLTKLRGKENENVDVSASTQLSQKPWEAKVTRMLTMALTDGVQDVQGMEYRSIPTINLQLSPGTKVLVHGEVTCRNGMLMLKPENVSVLGGEVEALLEANSPEANIECALEQNRSVDQPQTARKEFQTAPKQNPQQRPSNKPRINQGASTQQRSNQQQRSMEAVQMNVNDHNVDMPTADEWGDDDMEEMFEGLDDSDIAAPPVRARPAVNESMDLEAMMDDDLDDEILLSQDLLVPPPKPAQPPRSAQTAQRTLSHGANPQPNRSAGFVNRLSNTHGAQENKFKDQRDSAQDNPYDNASQRQYSHGSNRQGMMQRSPPDVSLPNRTTSTMLSSRGSNNMAAPSKPSSIVSPWRETANEKSSNVCHKAKSQHGATVKPLFKTEVSQTPEDVKKSIALDSSPYTYLSKVQESWPPSRIIDITVKAYVATLLDKLEHGNGKGWSLRAKINDGSAVMDVILSDEILTSLIGFSASECMKFRQLAKHDVAIRTKLTMGIKSCQESLINMSAMLEIRLDPAQSAPVVLRHRPITLEDLIALHDRNKK